jgi:hypothetical protein
MFELAVSCSGFIRNQHFPHRPSGVERCTFSTQQLVQAAIFAGHPSDVYPLIDLRLLTWRLATIRLAVEQRRCGFLFHPGAWAYLDPTEKSQIQYQLGNAVTKLLCESLLETGHLVFLDVYHPNGSRKKRPDFVARTRSGVWYVVEAKGRQRRMGKKKLAEVKRVQAQALPYSASGQYKAHVVCCVHASGGIIGAQLHDPPPRAKLPSPNLDRFFRLYYRPLADLANCARLGASEVKMDRESIHLTTSDLIVHARPEVWSAIQRDEYEPLAHLWADRDSIPAKEGSAGEFQNLDGVAVELGPSWIIN